MPLSILSASAGSGKTYRLSREYVKLSLESEDASYASGILAMTFTNKATSEMKIRILELLHQIYIGKESPKDEDDILYPLFNQIGHTVFKDRAGKVLKYLLKQYHFFSISTIDSFFQAVIRQFQRELNLDQPFRVELDTKYVLEKSIDTLLNDIIPNSTEYKWLIEWVKEKLVAGQTWDIRKDLAKLGKELFEEGVTESWSELDLDAMQSIFYSMQKYMENVDQKYALTKDKLRELLLRVDLQPEDFKNAKSSFVAMWLKRSYMELLDSSAFRNTEDNIESWFKKDVIAVNCRKLDPAADEFLALKNEVNCLQEDCALTYKSYKAVCKSFRTYIAIRFLYESVKKVCRECDIMLLSESNKLVSKVVKGSDISLLYEKSGLRYQHIMIDEFQDTSQSQWNNLRPLVENSMSLDLDSLIVGDVKQAVYRFRNGDWQIMHSGIERDLSLLGNIERGTLDKNWRSAQEIVSFNNQLFERAKNCLIEAMNQKYGAQKLIEDLDIIYSNVSQHAAISDKLQGCVEVEILSNEVADDIDENDPDINEKYIHHKKWLHQRLHSLYALGYVPGDIAFLVRNNSDASTLVNWMQQWEYEDGNGGRFEAISENGFLLNNNAEVRLLISALRYNLHPNDKSILPYLIHYWSGDNISEDLFSNYSQDRETPFQLEILKELRSGILSEWFSILISKWDLGNKSVAHLSAFLDCVRSFELQNGSDPHLFLSWWDNKSKELGIPQDEKVNAVQVLTIHKSKGLQYKVVIVPFTHTKLVDIKSTNLLYVEELSDPLLCQLGQVPVNTSNNVLADTFFYQNFVEECILTVIDNLNLLYVTNTRPEQRLIIAVVEPKKKEKQKENDSILKGTIGDLILNAFPESFKVSGSTRYFGNLMVAPKLDKIPESRTLIQTNHLVLRTQQLSTGLWLDKELPIVGSAVTDQNTGNVAISYGKLIHLILERLGHWDELDSLIKLLVEEGHIPHEHSEKVRNQLTQFLNIPQVRAWYEPGLRIYSEREIIELDGKAYRPDRVVLYEDKTILIDFKTGKKSVRYAKQLDRYRSLLERMGLPKIEAWLAYIDLAETDQVMKE
jgi:ATP-dependent helicase/nuclease subunit A